MVNKLIVESLDDQIFIEAILRHYQNDAVAIEPPICHIDDFECMRGLNDGKLSDALSNLKNQMVKNDIRKAGIIIDHDGRVQERLAQINKAVHAVFDVQKDFTAAGEFIGVSTLIDGEVVNLELGCFLMGIGNRGELETVLRIIAKSPAPYADCLVGWSDCVRPLIEKEPFKNKEFEKLWVDAYMRWDTCSSKERRQAGRKCSKRDFDSILKKDIWDFDHAVLDDLKAFLSHFH